MYSKDFLVSMYQFWQSELENTHHCDPEYLDVQRDGEDLARMIAESPFSYEEIENAND